MKKRVWAKMLSLALVFVCVIGLAACGGGDTSAAGTYKLQTISAAGISMDIAQLAEAQGLSEDDLKCNLELKSDGSFTLDMSALDESQSLSGTWEQSGKNISITVDGETSTVTLEDGVITIEESGASMTFKK